MSQYLRGVDISQYYSGQVSALCNYFSNQGTPLDIVQVELICGTTSQLTTTSNSNPEIINVIKDVKSNNLKLGYYAYLYPYIPGWSTATQQGEAFVSAYKQVQEQLGVVPDCKIMIDIELGAFKKAGIPPSSTIAQSMVSDFVEAVNAGLGSEQEYVVYGSKSGISTLFKDIDTSKYGLIVSSPTSTYTMQEISYPTSNPIPDYVSNWDNWTGVQFNFGPDQDYDIYTEDMLLSNSDLKVGDYVKILSSTTNFAPNLIPISDKGVNYTIEAIDGSMCKLSDIDLWVNYQDLNLIQEGTSSSEPESTGNSSNNKSSNDSSWDDLDEITQLALYIASFEGFSEYPYHCGTGKYAYSIGYGTYAGNLASIEPEAAFEIVKSYIIENKPSWDNAINGWSDAQSLSTYEKFGLYNFAYEMGLGHLGNNPQGLIALIANIKLYGKDPMQTFYWWSTGADLQRRMSAESIAFMTGKLYFGEPMNQLPPKYLNAIQNMPCISSEASNYLPIY